MNITRLRWRLWGVPWAALFLSPAGCEIQDGQFDGSLILDPITGGISNAISKAVEALVLIFLI